MQKESFAKSGIRIFCRRIRIFALFDSKTAGLLAIQLEHSDVPFRTAMEFTVIRYTGSTCFKIIK